MENDTLAAVLNSSSANASPAFQSLTDGAASVYPERLYFILVGVVGSSVCCVGLVGNLLNTLVFALMLKHGATSSATNLFLLCISVADFSVLLLYLIYDVSCVLTPPRPLLDVQSFTIGQLGSFSYYVYYVWYLPTNIFILMSNWFTVSVTAFRFIAVYFPMKAYDWCALNRAKLTLLVVAILAVGSALPDFFTIRLEYVENFGFLFSDTALYDSERFHSVYYTYLFMINGALPFSVCLLFSLLLIGALRRSDDSVCSKGAVTQLSRRLKDQKKISAMLLGVVFCYIVCTIPSLVWRALKPAAKSDAYMHGVWLRVRAVADVCLIIQHSANFIIYLSLNHMYRKYFRHLTLRRLTASGIKGQSQPTVVTRSFRQRCGTATSSQRPLSPRPRPAERRAEISEGGIKPDRVELEPADSPLLEKDGKGGDVTE